MKPITTWIVVADGARASFYVNKGPGKGIQEAGLPSIIGMHEPSREINADRPGRMQTLGAPRHGLDWTSDPHREQKRAFAKNVAEFLKLQARKSAFDRLVLVAPAKTLGDLRGALDAVVADRVTEEVAKDLTHFNARELTAHLDDVIAV